MAEDDNDPPLKRAKVVSPITSASDNVNEKHPRKSFVFGKDAHIQVLLAVEYHGVSYGGWQRQGPKNNIKFPSVQGTLEQAATKVCDQIAFKVSIELIPTTENRDLHAVMAGSSGRTDRGVHALDHKCMLRLPFSKDELPKLTNVFGGEASPFLSAINETLPADIHVLTCRIVTRHQRKELRFGRKRYTYLIQQAPDKLNRPWPAWNDYTYYCPRKLETEKMQQALDQMQGTHDFLPLSCQKGKPNTIRTLNKGIITVVQHPLDSLLWFRKASRSQSEKFSSIFDAPDYGIGHEPARNSCTNLQQLDPKNYRIIQIDFEGSGFLRHQVRRMMSVLVKVGEGVWEPDIVHRILYEEKNFLQGRALAPGRALWKAKVWIDEAGSGNADGAGLDDEEDE